MIRLQQVSVSRGRKTLFHDLSLDIHLGLTYLLGLNGSGKSTLLHCLLRTIPYEGNIFINKQNIRNISRLELARLLAFVPQHQPIPGFLTVEEFALMGRYPHLDRWGTYRKSDHVRVQGHLETLGIRSLKSRKVSRISGGELQRVILAKALCQETPILLLDEPDQSLDPKARLELADLLQQLAEAGKLVLCVTHDLEGALSGDARVLGLKSGEIVLDRTDLSEAKNRSELMRIVYDREESSPRQS